MLVGTLALLLLGGEPLVGDGDGRPERVPDPPGRSEQAERAPLLESLHQPWSWSRFDTQDGLPSPYVLWVLEDHSGTPWAITDRGPAWFDGYRWNVPPGNTAPKGTCFESTCPLQDGFLAIYCTRALRVSRAGVSVSPPWFGRTEVLEAPRLGHYCGRFDGERVTATLEQGGGLQADMLSGELVPYDVPLALTVPVANSPDFRRSWLRTTEGFTTWEDGEPRTDYTLPADWNVDLTLLCEDGSYGVCTVGTPVEHCGLHEWDGERGLVPVERLKRRMAFALALHESGDCVASLQDGSLCVREGGVWSELVQPIPHLRGLGHMVFRPDGDLWCSTRDGLYLLHRQPSRWTHALEGPRLRAGNATLDVLRDSGGHTWFATTDGLLRRSPQGTIEEVLGPSGEMLPAVTTLHEDPGGTIWLGSGAGTFDGALCWREGTWSHVGADEGLHAPAVHAIRRSLDGTLWFLEIPGPGEPEGVRSTHAHGLRDGRWTRLPIPTERPPARWYDLVDDGRGSLWVATSEGLLRYESDDPSHVERVRELLDLRVYTLAVDAKGHVWFGHQVSRAGLGRVDLDGSVHYVAPEEGRLAPWVNDLAFGSDGRLWIASETGLLSYEDGRWQAFEDPRLGATGRSYVVLPEADQVLIGSTAGGTSSFSLVDPVDAPPRVVLEVPDRVEGHLHAQVLTGSWWGETPREKLWVRHRLDGGGWSPWDHRTVIELDPSPGEHALEVEVRGPDGEADTGSARRRFWVANPHEGTLWLVASLCVLLLASSGAALVSLRRKRLRDAELRESEARFRQLADNMAEVFWLSDRVQRRMLFLSPAFDSITGRDRRDVLAGRERMDESIHPEDRERVRARFRERAEHGDWEGVFRILRPDGSVRWVRDRAYPVRDARGRVVRLAGVTSDVTEQEEAHQRQELMRRELDHRVKNTLAGVLALTDHGSLHGSDVQGYRRTLTGRVRAMARAHELLSAGRWSRVALRDLVALVVLPYVDPEERLVLEGESLFVPPAVCTPLAMALHELTTNATKYGALSDAEGGVELSWTLEQHELLLLWREHDGPPVAEPERSGLGLSLVRGVVEHELSGTCSITFDPGGLQVELSIPLDRDRPDPARA